MPAVPPMNTRKEDDSVAETTTTALWTVAKLLTAAVLCAGAFSMQQQSVEQPVEQQDVPTAASSSNHRRLTEEDNALPLAAQTSPLAAELQPLFQDLTKREKLFADTPPEEVKYWFEYTDPLQKYYYRFSRSRGKADYFEGRDDSGVVSSRFVEPAGGTREYQDFYQASNKDNKAYDRLWNYCLAMGSTTRPNTSAGSVWNAWFGNSSTQGADRCRILFTMNTVGAGRGSTLLWETNPPALPHSEGPPVWTSEQETAATHLARNFKEINALCASGKIAARVQVLVCEPISPKWTDWMDAQLPACGGKASPLHVKEGETQNNQEKLEERPSPVQIVVTASSATADSCHDLKSGFMEKRVQDLVLAPPYLDSKVAAGSNQDPSIKSTHPDLVSSDPHDLYVALKWSSLVTMRAVHAFLQASADLAAAASSPVAATEENTMTIQGPASPFLVPSFVRVAYVSEENSKVAKWRMHGDFFHPAAWEICKDSFDTTWIPNSLAGNELTTALDCRSPGSDCGQWWVYFHELQMPTSPEVYANEVTPAPVQGGSNFIWMVTERQRQELVKVLVCKHENKPTCPDLPQAVIPLGDLESFLINFTPNTALGREHVKDRNPGYSHAEEREADRKRVKERKQLHDQEEIEEALFDYTIYPAALFHKDATIKAARARDKVLSGKETGSGGPQTCKSSYYDITITKPRPAKLGWCQAVARRGLCSLYADFFRQQDACREACGLNKDWTKVDGTAATA